MKHNTKTKVIPQFQKKGINDKALICKDNNNSFLKVKIYYFIKKTALLSGMLRLCFAYNMSIIYDRIRKGFYENEFAVYNGPKTMFY